MIKEEKLRNKRTSPHIHKKSGPELEKSVLQNFHGAGSSSITQILPENRKGGNTSQLISWIPKSEEDIMKKKNYRPNFTKKHRYKK